MRNLIRFLILLLSYAVMPVEADLSDNSSLKHAIPQQESEGYVAKIRLHTAEEIEKLLEKAEQYIEGTEKYPDFDPIAVILHGPELKVFARENYQMYKHIVELAARLEAFNVIDVRVCEVQMRRDGIEAGDLPAFVDTVPYGPDEERRLLKRGYQYF